MGAFARASHFSRQLCRDGQESQTDLAGFASFYCHPSNGRRSGHRRAIDESRFDATGSGLQRLSGSGTFSGSPTATTEGRWQDRRRQKDSYTKAARSWIRKIRCAHWYSRRNSYRGVGRLWCGRRGPMGRGLWGRKTCLERSFRKINSRRHGRKRAGTS